MKQNKIWEYTKSIGLAIVLSLIIRASIVHNPVAENGTLFFATTSF
jgi:hypothetical protein